LCEVISGRSPGNIRYEDDDVVVFDNELTWVPVMLLVTPKKHRTQAQMWGDPALLGKIGELAVEYGSKLCPGGYRLLSNFGNDALQTQEHAHLHVIGGTKLGLYVRPPG
jgi:histidine triad (HIT) family protein